ncbi:MAG: hypothetical protein ABSB76_41120, partial [Streptosporangiaceae bacterium]
FGRKLSNRTGRIDLSGISQRWLRDLAWDHLAGVFRSPGCPSRSGTPTSRRSAGGARRPRR